MSKGTNTGLADVIRVFVSSSSREMERYREEALDSVGEVGMVPINFNDPEGAGFTQSSGTNLRLEP
jgi:hypothetical protein